MNINDLQPTDYKVISPGTGVPLNINNLPKGSYSTVAPQDQQEPDFFTKVSTDLGNAGQGVQDAISGTGQFAGRSPIGRAVGATESAFNAIPAVAGELPVVGPALNALGKGISGGINAAGNAFANAPRLNPKVPTALESYGKDLSHTTQSNPGEEILKTAQSAGNIANDTLLAGGLKVGAGELPKPIIEKTASALKTGGEKVYGLNIPMEKPTRIAVQGYQAQQPNLMGRIANYLTGTEIGTKPITETNTALRNNLAGTEWQLGVQAKRASNGLWNKTIAPALDESGAKVNMKNFFGQVEKQIRAETPELERRNALLEGVQALKEHYSKVGSVSLKKLQEYKEGFAKFLPDSSYQGKPIGSALKEVKDIAAENARKLIYDNTPPEVKQAYIDYGNLKSIEKAGQNTMDKLDAKSFTKQIWEAVADKAITPVTTLGGQILYKTGEGLEYIGKPGARRVRDIVAPPPLQNTNQKNQ